MPATPGCLSDGRDLLTFHVGNCTHCAGQFAYLMRVIYLRGGLVKFVSVSDLRLKPGQVWEDLDREEEMIITSKGKPIALLTRVNEQDFEKTVAAVRRARALMAMEGMQCASVLGGKDRMSDAQIEAEIKAARRTRAR